MALNNRYYKTKEDLELTTQEVRATDLKSPITRSKKRGKRKPSSNETTTQEISRDTMPEENLYSEVPEVSYLPKSDSES